MYCLNPTGGTHDEEATATAQADTGGTQDDEATAWAEAEAVMLAQCDDRWTEEEWLAYGML